jgi:hypothetical protein
MVLVIVQPSVPGLYLPPLLKLLPLLIPPHTIISLPVQIAVCTDRATGALVVLVIDQVSVAGLYLPPEPSRTPASPPHTIISLPVQTALWAYRGDAALAVLVAIQVLSVQPVVGVGVGVCAQLVVTRHTIARTISTVF